MAMKYCFKVDKHMWACMVLPVNGFCSTNLIFICSWLLLFANGGCIGVIAGIAVVYMGMNLNPMDGPVHCSVIIAFYLLSFRKL